jgi:galactokinase
MTTTWAPGRVNLIGEHTDYSGGLVLPIALQLGLTTSVSRRARDITLISNSFGLAAAFAADGSGPAPPGWGRYGHAVAAELDALGRPPIGLEASIDSTVPAGSGLSSSAALEVGLALALCAVADFEIDDLTLAQACQRAEARAVGVPCGILDQAASLLGRANCAVLLDCTSLDVTLTPIPDTAAFLIVDSGVNRQLEHTGYSERRRELESALSEIGASSPRAVSIDATDALPPVLRHRLRHVITENERVVRFAKHIGAGDLRAAGDTMSESHASLRDDYEVSTPELNSLVQLAQDHGAFGARLLGGGFGGSVVALVPTADAAAIGQTLRSARPQGRPPILARASDGAAVISDGTTQLPLGEQRARC